MPYDLIESYCSSWTSVHPIKNVCRANQLHNVMSLIVVMSNILAELFLHILLPPTWLLHIPTKLPPDCSHTR